MTFRGWSSTPTLSASGTAIDNTNPILSDEATITVYVKTGANTPPTFFATGFIATVNETTHTDEITIGPASGGGLPANPWNARDVDPHDKLTYRLEGNPATACTMADGTPIDGAVALGRGCAWLDSAALGLGNVLIKGKNIDYESAPPNKTYTITLVASDGYNPATDARIPISIVVRNVDEPLEFSGTIRQISQLVVGRAGRTVDLNDHFKDPDGTPVTYTAQSLTPNIVSVSLQGSMLTVNALGSAGPGQILITALSSGLASPHVIEISVRQTNRPPEFAQSILIISAPNPVAESQPSDHVIRLSSLRYTDPDGDTITAEPSSTALCLKRSLILS